MTASAAGTIGARSRPASRASRSACSRRSGSDVHRLAARLQLRRRGGAAVPPGRPQGRIYSRRRGRQPCPGRGPRRRRRGPSAMLPLQRRQARPHGRAGRDDRLAPCDTSGVRISPDTSSPSSSTWSGGISSAKAVCIRRARASSSVHDDAGAQRGQGDGPVHGAGVEELEAEPGREAAGGAALARAGRAVDGHDHAWTPRMTPMLLCRNEEASCRRQGKPFTTSARPRRISTTDYTDNTDRRRKTEKPGGVSCLCLLSLSVLSV